jgi:DNA (cytosine-5)-methyltransferase 1
MKQFVRDFLFSEKFRKNKFCELLQSLMNILLKIPRNAENKIFHLPINNFFYIAVLNRTAKFIQGGGSGVTFIDFFAGIGGFTAGLTQARMNCAGFCEKDKFAVKSYTAIHSPKKGEWFCDDITEADGKEIPFADGWTAGFPCQDISVCGRQRGLSGARSGLFFEIIRLLRGKSAENRPKWVLFENVRNLIGVNEARDFTAVLAEISDCGYDCEWAVINSKNYVPQNRERVFIIGHLRNYGDGRSRKVFPLAGANAKTFREPIEVIGGRQGNRVYCPKGGGVCLTAQSGGFSGKTGLYCAEQCFIDLCAANPKTTEIARCIKARYNSGISNRCELSGVLTGGRVRKLTPKECFRLQGFSDEMFEKAAAVNSDNQLYRQAGNSVTVPVIAEIGKKLMQIYGEG